MTDDDPLPPDVELYLPLNPGEHVSIRLYNVSLLLKVGQSWTAMGYLFVTNFQLLHVSRIPMPGSSFIHGTYIVSVNSFLIKYKLYWKEPKEENQSKIYLRFFFLTDTNIDNTKLSEKSN